MGSRRLVPVLLAPATHIWRSVLGLGGERRTAFLISARHLPSTSFLFPSAASASSLVAVYRTAENHSSSVRMCWGYVCVPDRQPRATRYSSRSSARGYMLAEQATKRWPRSLACR